MIDPNPLLAARRQAAVVRALADEVERSLRSGDDESAALREQLAQERWRLRRHALRASGARRTDATRAAKASDDHDFVGLAHDA